MLAEYSSGVASPLACASWCNPIHELPHCSEVACADCSFCTDDVKPCAEDIRKAPETSAAEPTLDCYPYTFSPLLLFAHGDYFDKGYSNYNSVAQFFSPALDESTPQLALRKAHASVGSRHGKHNAHGNPLNDHVLGVCHALRLGTAELAALGFDAERLEGDAARHA
mgnify:CR=1 FL=1